MIGVDASLPTKNPICITNTDKLEQYLDVSTAVGRREPCRFHTMQLTAVVPYVLANVNSRGKVVTFSFGNGP
jgi:hypothetical protein